ncbi:MAG: low specificity L-threonine aldolase [Rhodospirillaceae bacterium]
MNFRSDNVFAASPEIMAALVAANHGAATSYGTDPLTKGLEKTFGDLFGGEVAVFPTVTGTAANALCLATLTPAYGAIFCHDEAHIYVEEAGGPEFYTGGAKLMPISGKHGQMDLALLKEMMHTACARSVHWMPPAVVSVTQSTEAGTVYSLDALRAIIGAAKEKGLRVHMDGSRLGNALARLGCSPQELTTKLGIDALSFGATKNGALGAEAVVLFKPTKEQRERLAYLHKRGGHLVSKMRFVSAQLEAYVKDGHWLKNAAHANTMGARLAAGLKKIPGAVLEHPVEANEVFVRLPDAVIKALQADGAGFARWGAADTTLVRLVCSFATTEKDVDDFLAAAKKRMAEVGGKAA